MHHVPWPASGVNACAAARHASLEDLLIQEILYSVYHYILLSSVVKLNAFGSRYSYFIEKSEI